MFSLNDPLHALGTKYQKIGPKVVDWIGITGRLEMLHAAVPLAKIGLLKDRLEELQLMAKLSNPGDRTVIYYPKPLRLQAAFAYVGYEAADFPASEDVAGQVFSLPTSRRRERETIDGIARQ